MKDTDPVEQAIAAFLASNARILEAMRQDAEREQAQREKDAPTH